MHKMRRSKGEGSWQQISNTLLSPPPPRSTPHHVSGLQPEFIGVINTELRVKVAKQAS